MSEGWYYVDSERSVGPLTLTELMGTISKLPDWTDTLVWRAGAPDWETAGDVPELRRLMAMPPPAPSSRRTHEMPSWRVRLWWYPVALFFCGSIGSRDGRKAMAWASSERAKLRKLRRMPLSGQDSDQ
jgi:GYF domain 2